MVATVPYRDARGVLQSVVRYEDRAVTILMHHSTLPVQVSISDSWGHDNSHPLLHHQLSMSRVVPTLGAQVLSRILGNPETGLSRRRRLSSLMRRVAHE